MNRHRGVAALFLMLLLVACAQEVSAQAQAPYPPHPPETMGTCPSTAEGIAAVGGGGM
jgi:hypothetical protein